MVNLWFEIAMSFWILFPAYAANGFPPFARGKRPIDFGMRLKDGKRIFGDGKTFEGLFLGLLAGTLVGIAETLAMPYLNVYASQWNVQMIPMSIFTGFMISLGALVGDMCGSFIKRRIGMERGADAPLLDQLNFVFGTIVFAYFFTTITVWMIIIMFLVTPVIHRVACIIGYRLKIKQVPW